ncbi:MAG: flagellar hook-length control protein FliK, partial [Atribacterota bacterium]
RISCGNADSAVVMEAENTPEVVLGGTSSSETNSVPEAEDTCTAPLPPSLDGAASTPEVVLGEASPLAEEVDSSAFSAEVPASAESSTPSPEEQDTAPLLQRESERVAFLPEPKKDQAQNDTLSFEENTAQSLALVRDAKGFSPQETTSVTVKDFAKVFEEVLKGVSEVKGRKEVVLRLEPEHLGSIVVRLEDQGGKIHCIWEVANPETRALLVKYLPILEAHLGAQGMFFEHFLGDGSNAYSFWGGFWSQVPGGNQDEEVPPEDFEVSQVNFLV